MTHFPADVYDALGNVERVTIVRKLYHPSLGEVLVGSDGRLFRKRMPLGRVGIELIPKDDPTLGVMGMP